MKHFSIIFLIFLFCKIDRNINILDINKKNNIYSLIYNINKEISYCKFNPENNSKINNLTKIKIVCEEDFGLTQELYDFSNKYNLEIFKESTNDISFQNKNLFEKEGRIFFIFPRIISMNNKILSPNMDYTIIIDKSSPKVITSLSNSLVGTEDFSKKYIDLFFTEKVVNADSLSNYFFSGDAGLNLIPARIDSFGNNQYRLHFLGEIPKTGGRLILTIRNITDESKNILTSDKIEYSLASSRIYTKMLQSRRLHNALLIDNYIYIYGGRTGGENSSALGNMEIININNPSDKLLITPINIPDHQRFSHSMILLNNGKILISGGFNKQGVTLNSTFFFDRLSNSFMIGPNMPFQRSDFIVASFSSTHYFIGGEGTGSNKIDSYNEDSNTFSTKFTMNYNRDAGPASICYSNENFFEIFGGIRGTGKLDSIEIFNLNNITKTSLPSRDYFGFGFCKKFNNNYFFIGENTFGELWNTNMNLISKFSMVESPIISFSRIKLNDLEDLIIGGNINSNATSLVQIINYEKKNVKSLVNLFSPRSGSISVKIPNQNRILIIGGLYGPATLDSIEEIYW
jgi:hypothetical protein